MTDKPKGPAALAGEIPALTPENAFEDLHSEDDEYEQARSTARTMYGSDECEIDPGARVIWLDEQGAEGSEIEGSAWVQAWVFVPAEQLKS